MPGSVRSGWRQTRSTEAICSSGALWQTGKVLAVACDHQIATRARKVRADALVKKLPKRAWQKLSAGAGAKGHRFYDWALAEVADEGPGGRPPRPARFLQ